VLGEWHEFQEIEKIELLRSLNGVKSSTEQNIFARTKGGKNVTLMEPNANRNQCVHHAKFQQFLGSLSFELHRT
jgi:hypothetical protein